MMTCLHLNLTWWYWQLHEIFTIFTVLCLNVGISVMFFWFPPVSISRLLLKAQWFVIRCNHNAHPVPINQRDPQLMTPDFLPSVCVFSVNLFCTAIRQSYCSLKLSKTACCVFVASVIKVDVKDINSLQSSEWALWLVAAFLWCSLPLKKPLSSRLC